MLRRALFPAIFVALALMRGAHAQTTLVVNVCGVLPPGVTYSVGQVRNTTQDTTGKPCGNGHGGTALVVSSCGTLPTGTVYRTGQVRNATQDTTGTSC